VTTFEQELDTLTSCLSGPALDAYLASLPGRCTECGYHIATQGHRPGPRWFTGLEPWKDSDIEDADGCSQWTPQRPAGAGLILRCRDWHETCPCGNRYNQPKADGCRRRKHVKAISLLINERKQAA
jgi:hypothetical protein